MGGKRGGKKQNGGKSTATQAQAASGGLDVFISYAGADRPWAEWVQWQLRDVDPPRLLKPLVYRDIYDLDEEKAKARLVEAVAGRDAQGRPEFRGTAKASPKARRGPQPATPRPSPAGLERAAPQPALHRARRCPGDAAGEAFERRHSCRSCGAWHGRRG
jgi:hypothetical protein